MGDFRLVFGLGATKAGSGWLSRYLRFHPECHLSLIKELHFFDTLEKDVADSRVRGLLRWKKDLARNRHAGNHGLRRKIYEIRRWWPVVKSQDPQAYVDFLKEEAGDARLLGDITPAYALLPTSRLQQMAGLLPDVRFVYLMRDPVARLWSHVRMLARSSAATPEQIPTRANDLLELSVSGGKDDVVLRGAYDAVVSRLRSAVEQGRLFLGYLEDLVTPQGVEQLCGFLNIAPVPAKVDRKVHEGIHLPMTDQQRSRALAYLRPQYDFARAEMGRLPAAWETSLARG